jgi:hypothetical protein
VVSSPPLRPRNPARQDALRECDSLRHLRKSPEETSLEPDELTTLGPLYQLTPIRTNSHLIREKSDIIGKLWGDIDEIGKKVLAG